ncbi:hypothetical protein Ae406Ps2_6292 [Pseudonocardia sp. Ae406_Ps2]|uniref:hypothetical protein n=1 Tax=unclassified Pseudonocardia TaxID=2619320 RepID=UPI00094ADF63|nr:MULTISPECIES: hypothetical protein [unclassified Pseudonocardia]OLL89522.1 hypothetical protein Ae331Ps2_6196c [Pseudonocardia sp. Ae331_Ps2]OLL89977.1 hypothetical protein Ae406Ps2_6279 [Pseudonocardia sp. Ae406_Ps2]OLL89990.1 hypothetical protein Ae406Ps2_6292 [Pseudonocardia sp. Ae406_Ps2]OLM09451.1 hypothetical protein Ae706Ps2_6349 [Pseudonocardia sp. Ae706_Ps2]
MTAPHWPAQDPAPPPAAGGGGWNPISGLVGDSLRVIAKNAFSSAMQWVWDAAIWLLKGGFTIADTVSRVEPGVITGRSRDNPDPIPPPEGAAPPEPPEPPEGAESAVDLGSLWSTMIWLAAVIALGLFFYQLTMVAVRGGRGMMRAVTGPAQFGIALAVTTGAVAVLLTGADGLTTMFLSWLGEYGSFTAILDNHAVAARFGDNPDLGADIEDSVRSMVLGITALFGIIPAAVGFALAMIFRTAAIMVLIATIPIAAACLIADTTAPMFWRVVRWLIAAVLMKPAFALVIVIGVAITSRAQGVAGLLAATAVLLISLFSPTVLYRMLPFVEPGTNAGMALRSLGSPRSSGSSEPTGDNGTSEMINTARATQHAYDLGNSSSNSGSASGELGGSTATARGTSSNAGRGAAAGAGAVGGAAAAAVVGGYLATKAAGQAADGYASSQMATTGIGHPGPAPAAVAGIGQIISAARSAYNATSNRIAHGSGDDRGPDEPGETDGGGNGGDGPAPPPVDPGPTEPTPPGGGGPPDPPEPAPVNAGAATATTTAPAPERPARPGPGREDNR